MLFSLFAAEQRESTKRPGRRTANRVLAHHDEDAHGVGLELGVVLQGRVAGVAQEGEHLLGPRRNLKDPFFSQTKWQQVQYMLVIIKLHDQ